MNCLFLSILLLTFLSFGNLRVHGYQVNRRNFCDVHEKVQDNEILLKDSLRGMNLTAAISHKIDEENPYIAVRVLDRLAEYASFNIEYIVTGVPSENETWTDVLLRNVRQCDIACDWFQKRPERIEKGIVFPQGWYDAEPIMIKKKQDSSSYQFWAFAMPFSPQLWILTVFAIAATGASYFLLDYFVSKPSKERLEVDFLRSIFYSFHAFTGHCNYETKSRSLKLLSTSMCFLYIILISAYTANLANFFVLKKASESSISTLKDAVEHGYSICVVRGYANTLFMMRQFPNAFFVQKNAIEDVYNDVSDGECIIALTSIEEWKMFKNDKRYNKGAVGCLSKIKFSYYCASFSDCDLEWIGRRVDTTEAGFAIQDSRSRCSSLLMNVLSLFILEMKAEGILNDILNSVREKTYESSCEETSRKNSSMETVQLNVSNMSGAFTFHMGFVVVSIILAVYEFFRQPNEVKSRIRTDVKKSFEVIMNSAKSSPSDTNFIGERYKKNEYVIKNDHNDFLQKNIFYEKIKNIESIVAANKTLTIQKLEKIISLFEIRSRQQEEDRKKIQKEIEQLQDKFNNIS